MAEKKSWRDYSQSKKTENSTGESTDSKKTGSWRDYSKLESKSDGGQTNDWRSYTTLNTTSIVGDNIVNRVNSWLQNHNSYISEYQKRHEGRKYSYEDAYVSDSADWLTKATERKSSFDTEAEGIISYIDQYKGYLDQGWIDKIKYAITSARSTQNQLILSSKKDNEYWSKFTPNEEQTAAGYTADKLYAEWQAEQKQYAEDQVYDVEAGLLELEGLKKERDAYLATVEEEEKKKRENEPFWATVGRYMGNTGDTTFPVFGANGTSNGSSPTKEYDDRIAELEERIERSKYVQGYEGYMGNIEAEDYVANSQYVSTRTDVAKEDALWGLYKDRYDESKLFGDFLYDYINRNQDALDVAMVNDTASNATFYGFDQSFLQTMTDDEIGVYNYIYHTQSPEAAKTFLSHIQSDLKGRKRAQEQAFWASYAKSDPVGSSVFSVLVSPMKGISYLGQAADMLDDGKMEQNAGYNRFSYIPSTIRSQVSTTIENSGKWGKVGSFAYNTGMSMADFLFTTAVSGGNQGLSLAIMGTGAAADATLAAKDRGLDDGQAFALGTIAGLAEVAMEKISLGAWLDGDMTEGALRYVLKNALSEGGEEAGTSIVNLLADVMIAGDKSEWNVAMQAYIDEGKSPQEAFGLVAAEQAAQIGLDALGGFLSGSAIGGGTYAGTSVAAKFQYGDTAKNTAKAQQLVTEGLELNPESRYVQKAKSKVDKGKNLTGMQVRNILAANKEQITANDMKKIQQAAEKRLANLGQTENVSEVAEIATKWATGQEITRAEKKLLTHSQYGSRVANELLPDNIDSGNYSTEWTEDIGTRSVNAAQYNKKAIRELIDTIANAEDSTTYKSLEDRVGTESTFKVAKDGQATIHETGEAINLDKAEVAELVKDKNGKIVDMVIKADGKEVKASEVDYSDDTQSYLYEAVSKIENITPAAATAIIRDYDSSSGLSVGEYLNGVDEGYTYGYYGYTEADLKAGNFAPKLSDTQMKSAYVLGQSAKKISDADADAPIVKMRTAMDAKLTAEQKTAKQKARIESNDVEVYFQDGKSVVKFDEHTGKYDAKRKAAVNTAKFLSKLSIGGKYYFFESYVNADGVRVYKDADGNEVEAPNGVYKDADGSIHIDLNAGDYGQGTALFTMGHELGHFVKAQSKKQFKILGDLITEAFAKTDMSMHERVLEKQKFLEDKRGKAVSYDEAFEEVVCDALSTMLTDGSFYEKIMEIKVKDKGLFNTIKRFFQKMIAKFNKVYEELTPDQRDAQDIRAMKDMFDKIQTAFVEGLVEASDNFQAAMESVVEADAEAVSADEILTDDAVVTNGEGERFSIRSMKHDITEGKMFEDLKNVCGWTNAQVNTLRTQLKDLVEYMIPYRAILDMNETYGMEGRRFSPYKPNSDPLYKISMDFSTLCSKRLLTQYVIEQLQLRENRPMSAEEQMAIRDMLNEYRKVEKGLQVACAMCYVEAARLKSPKQVQRWLDDPAPLLKDYFGKKNKEFNDSVKKAQADFKESKGYDREAPKKDMKPADVKELNKIGPKMRSQYKMSAEEQAIIERAKSLPNSTYLTAGNLANLSETDPVIYDAYTAFVRSATRSKSLEKDEPYYYGDSTRDNGNGIVVTDSFIEAVNKENGMRFSSWSDWRIQHLLDYITAVIDNSVRGAAMHGYTKFGDEVRVLGKTGMMFNMSGVAGTQTGLNEDGSLSFSPTESIDVNEAIQLREEFPETAGLQCIGVSDAHIVALLKSDIIDYVIPYHVSGLNAALRRMVNIHGWADYTGTQHASIDKSIKLENAVDKEHWREEPVFSEFFVGYDTGMTGIEAMRASAEKYKQMCKDRGLTPKFNQFANEDNYWKLLIDRKMINQQTGNLIKQKAVTPIFDFDTIKGVVDKFVDNYDSGLEGRALNHIVENWDSIPQRIKDLKKQGGTKANKTTKAMDTLANQTVAAQPKDGVKNSDRKTGLENNERIAYSNRRNQKVPFKENVFPPFDESHSEAHELAERWSRKENTEPGDRKLISFHKQWYLIEALDGMKYGYQIIKPVPAKDYDKEAKACGTFIKYTSLQETSYQNAQVYSNVRASGGGRYRTDSFMSEHGRESTSVYGVDSAQNRGGESNHNSSGNNESGSENRERGREPSVTTRRLDELSARIKWLGNQLKNDRVSKEKKTEYRRELRELRNEMEGLIFPSRSATKNSDRNSERNNVPTFYSQMGKVVEGMKQEKFGASSVISMLRGRGVKAEEIRWSGIQAFLDGKKSVTKAELLEFIKGSMLHVEEEEKAETGKPELWDDFYRHMEDVIPYFHQEEIEEMCFDYDGEFSAEKFETELREYVEDGTISEDDFEEAMEYAEEMGESLKNKSGTQWSQYKLDGGSNYRELIFKMPGADYTNQAMQTHWGKDAQGVLAHARIQDLNTFIGKMLFIEEIQSDWHNEGHTKGYESAEYVDYDAKFRELNEKFSNSFMSEDAWAKENDKLLALEEQQRKNGIGTVPNAPFSNNYHEYVLKRLIRMAAEEGYDSIGWTTADIQSQRWSEDYAEGYRIEYDQDIPKFLKKYGKQWDTTVGKTVLDNGTEVWGMAITDSMKDSVLTEGQAMYSERGDGTSNRHLLANAFEGITKSSVEYKMLQDYKDHIKLLNEQEEKLAKLNAEIRQIRFGTTGPRDTARLTQLENEAKDVVKEINRYDKRLLSLEASEPLRKVIERERKKEAQKTKDHVKEIQQNKKVRAEQTELRHKIRKAIRDLDKILNRGNKQKNVKEDLQPVVTKALQAAEILFTDNYGSYDMLRNGLGVDLSDSEEALVKTCTQMLKDLDKMPTDGYDNWQARQEAENKLRTKMSKLNEVFARERKRLNNTTVSSILSELADAYKSLETSDQSYVQGAYSEPVYNFLKNLQNEVGGTIVKDMSTNQLENVYAAYKMVLNTVRNANKMFNEELKQTREQLGNAVIEEVLKAGGVHLLGTKMGDAISQFDWNNMKPIWLSDRIGSDTFGKLMSGLFKGQYNFAVDIDGAKKFKLEMDKKYNPRSWDAKKLYEFESSTGKKFSLNLQQIMSLYAFSKREQAHSHLLNGGFVFEDNSTVVVDGKLGIKRTYIHKGATSYKLNEATLNGIVNSLTAEQKAYADEMQKYLSDVMGAKGNEVSMQLYGIKMFNEQFYFPLRSSGAYMERAKEAELKKQQGQINLVNSGFTHSVKPEAKNPIILAGFMDVWAEHCNEMSMYHSMVLPMEDFRKVYNYSTIHDEKMESASVYQTIQDAYGKAATNYIDQLYRELNAGATVDPRETPYKKLISNFKKAAVMLSGSVVVQQFSSIGRAYAVIDPKYFIGTKVNSHTNLSVAEEMKKYAPVAIIKEMGGFDTGTKGSAKSYIMAEQYGIREWRKAAKDEQFRGDIMGILPAKADEITWCAIWEAAKRETKAKNPKMDIKSEEFLKLAGERFSEVTEKTQVYDSVMARSANMRSKSGLMQMATAFMAEPTTTVNLVENAIRSGNAKKIARAFGSVAVSIVLNNALASIVYAMRDDDEDETFLEKYFQSFTSGMIDDINPMSYYPFLKDVYSLFQGYDVERADMSVIADVRDALKRVVNLLGKDTSEMDDDELAEYYKQVNEVFMGLLDAGCSMFGVPMKNVRRDAEAIFNGIKTIGGDLSGERNTTWASFWDKVGSAVKDTIPIYAWTKDTAKTDKLYSAIISGDKAYLERLKGTYKTEDAYQSAVRKALRENDPRIHDAAQARYEGRTEDYKRIFREIQNEGRFSFDDIMSAINTELSKLTPDKVTSDYTASSYVEAIAMGNTSDAQAMKDDIIATKVANGKTQEEAEKEFASNVAAGVGKAYSSGLLDEAGAKNMLMEYADMDEEEATSRVGYWAFCEENPKYDYLSESNVNDYREFAEPAEIPLDVFAQYVNGTKGLVTKKDEWGDVDVTKREQVLEVIDSLPLTWQQKDALYLAAGYSESKIWDVPW